MNTQKSIQATHKNTHFYLKKQKACKKCGNDKYKLIKVKGVYECSRCKKEYKREEV